MIPLQIYSETLPPPDLKGYLPLSSAIQKLRQSEDLRNHILDIREISQLLWATQGITHDFVHRTVPSAGATYPLEIYVIHNGSTTLKKGVYNYIPENHRLNHISSGFNFSMLLSSLHGKDQDAVLNVSTTFLILAEYSRTTQRYNSYHSLYTYRGIQYVHLEVGHAIQNFFLQLTALDLNSRVIGNFTSQLLKGFLNTTLEPMAILPVGIYMKKDSLSITAKRSILDNEKGLTVEQAIAKRKSIRDYQDGKIPLSIISDILNDSVRIPQIWENNSHLDFRLVVGGIDGLQNGLYEYSLKNNSIIQLLEGDLRQDLKEAGLNQIWIETAQLDIVISGDTHWINQQSDPILYHRLMMYKIGMIAQNIYLKCASHRLGTVVVGAFYEGSTSLVVNTPDTYTPIYIIPIGLTPEFFEETIILNIPLTELARISGLYSYIPFYISLYLSLPIIKRRMTRKMRWIHCISGTITLIGALFHFMALHGHVSGFWDFLNINSYYTAVFFFIATLISLPTTWYNIGMFVVNITIALGTIVAVTGFSVAFKLVKKRKLPRIFHKYTVFLIIGIMILHALLNGTIFASKPFLFLWLNILVLDLYLILLYSPEFYKTIHKNEILSQ